MSVKLGKHSRSVSIIGVGCTPFSDVLTDPKVQGLTEGELFRLGGLGRHGGCRHRGQGY